MKKTILAIALSAIIYPAFSTAKETCTVDVTIQNNTEYLVLEDQIYHIFDMPPKYIKPFSAEVVNFSLGSQTLHLSAQGMADKPVGYCQVSVTFNNHVPTISVKDMYAKVVNSSHRFTCKLQGKTVVIVPTSK